MPHEKPEKPHKCFNHLLVTKNNYVSTHRNRPVVSENQNLLFVISYVAVLLSDIAFLIYGNFMEDIITDQ